MQLTILGQTPAQKNSKQIYTNSRTGKPFITSSNLVKEWQYNALMQLRQFKHRFKGRVQIEYMFYVVDDVQRDLDNMMASVNDILQQANALMQIKAGKVKPVKGTGIIQGDNWQLLRVGSADAAIDRKNPRAELIIKELNINN